MVIFETKMFEEIPKHETGGKTKKSYSSYLYLTMITNKFYYRGIV